jgi:ABC-2 type transport system permease protein
MEATLMPTGRILQAYLTEVKYETLRMLRSPAAAIPFLLLPVPIYLFFGVMLAAPATVKNPAVANYLFSGFLVFSVMMPALFGVGCTLAVERDAGVLRLKRALPAPGGAYLIAKMLMAVAFAAMATLTVLAAGLAAGKLTLSAGQLAIIMTIMIAGAIPFAAIGLLVGSYASGSAAPAFVNIVFLPMMYLSGLFIPLPKSLEKLTVIWPAFHLNQTALGAAGVTEFSFVPPLMSAAALVGVTVLFGGLAIRRLARVG